MNSEALCEETNLVGEAKEIGHIWEKALKWRIANRYNSVAVPQKFKEGDLVLRRGDIRPPHLGQGKVVANWEGPYKVVEVLGNGAYKLSTLSGTKAMRNGIP